MKKLISLLTICLIAFGSIKAAEKGEEQTDKAFVGGGLNVMSNYWLRGMYFGDASVVPYVNFNYCGLKAQAGLLWGWKNHYKNMGGELDLSLDYTYKHFTAGFISYWYSGSASTYAIPFNSWLGEIRVRYDSKYFSTVCNTIVIGDPKYSSLVEMAGHYDVNKWQFAFTVGVAPYGGWLYNATSFAVTEVELSATTSIKFSNNYSMGIGGSFGYSPSEKQWLYALKLFF